MTDRELLEKAAKAAGYTLDDDCDRTDVRGNGGGPLKWNPLEDDGDALRLAVKLAITVAVRPHECEVFDQGGACWCSEPITYEEEAAEQTRRAIVRAVAAMADAAGAA